MLKNPSVGTHLQINSSSPRHTFLYEIDWKDTYTGAEEPIRVTSSDQEVLFGGHIYSPYPVQHGDIKTTSNGQIQPVRVSVANVQEARFIQQIIEENDLIGRPVKIIETFEGSSDVIEMPFRISKAIAAKGHVTFTLGAGFDIFKQVVPRRIIYAQFCSWNFGPDDPDSPCEYSGSDTTCTKTWADCRRKGATRGFGGFPGIVDRTFFF